MDANSGSSKPLTLEPIEDPARGADGPSTPGEPNSGSAKGKHELHLTTTDEFLSAAAKEYEAGEIDAALWRRAGEQSRGDAALVIAAYLRARATALKLEHNERARSQRRARRDAAASQRKSEPPPEDAPAAPAGARRQGIAPAVKYAAAGVAALAAVGVGVWLIAAPRESSAVRSPAASAAVSAPSRPAPSIPRPSAQVAAGAAKESGPDAAELEARVRELKSTGNWNMLVIYAVDWTRKEPKNVQAWRELSTGYLNLRQFGDALDAANKAVQVVPGNASLWSNLGKINVAFARLPEAGVAFDRALALDPDDTDALCGAASVARQQGRPNDAAALTQRVRSEGGCPSATGAASAAAVATGTAIRRPPSANR